MSTSITTYFGYGTILDIDTAHDFDPEIPVAGIITGLCGELNTVDCKYFILIRNTVKKIDSYEDKIPWIIKVPEKNDVEENEWNDKILAISAANNNFTYSKPSWLVLTIRG